MADEISGEPQSLPPCLIIVSHWEGHGLKPLRRLLASMEKHAAGGQDSLLSYDLLIVSNGGDLRADQLTAPAARRMILLNRENSGYNIGAWDAGVRAYPGYPAYLFVQDECFIRRDGWLEAFRFRLAEDPGVGLVGESMTWDGMGWDYLKPATARDLGPPAGPSPIDTYVARLAEWGVARSPVASHLQSLVLYVSGELMQQLVGFQTGNSYSEAVTGEIAISQRAMAAGYRLALVRPGQPFYAIGHPQWIGLGPWKTRLNRKLDKIKAPVKRILGRGA